MHSSNEQKQEWAVLGRAAQIFLWVCLFTLLGYLFWVSSWLKVHYYDSLWILINARSIVEGNGEVYSWFRPPFLPLLFSVFLRAGDLFSAPESLAVLARVINLIFFASLLGISYKFYRLVLSPLAALTGIFLLSLNRLFIHYAPFCKEDIPGAFFAALSFYMYVLSLQDNRRRYFIWAGIFFTCSFWLRYQLAPMMFLVFLVFELIRFNASAIPIRRDKLFWGILFTIFAIATPVSLYAVLNHVGPVEALKGFVAELVRLFADTTAKESYWENFRFLAKSLTWPLVVLMVMGLLKAWRVSQSAGKFFILWFGVFFLIQTFIIGHKEARYLLALMAPVYFLVVCGLKESLEAIKRYLPGQVRKAATIFFLAGVSIWPVKEAYNEFARFNDPVNRSDLALSLAQRAADLSTDKNIYWVGPMYTVFPRDYVFDKGDEYTYIYHLADNSVYYYSGKPVINLTQGRIKIFDQSPESVFIDKYGWHLKDGDVVIANSEGNAYDVNTVPAKLQPLVLMRAKKSVLARFPAAEGAPELFVSHKSSDIKLSLSRKDGRYIIEGSGFLSKYLQLYVFFEGQPMPLDFVPFVIENGRFTKAFVLNFPPRIVSFEVLEFTHHQTFK